MQWLTGRGGGDEGGGKGGEQDGGLHAEVGGAKCLLVKIRLGHGAEQEEEKRLPAEHSYNCPPVGCRESFVPPFAPQAPPHPAPNRSADVAQNRVRSPSHHAYERDLNHIWRACRLRRPSLRAVPPAARRQSNGRLLCRSRGPLTSAR